MLYPGEKGSWFLSFEGIVSESKIICSGSECRASYYMMRINKLNHLKQGNTDSLKEVKKGTH